MKLPYRSALAVAALLALAACGNDKKEADQRTAVGKILPGSASDAMLPYDTVRSQSPLAPKAGSSTSASDEADASASDAAADGDSAPASVEEPVGSAESAAE